MNNNSNENKTKLVIPRTLLAAVGYLALVGVVIYGSTDHVYDGFGKAAPWIVGGIFAVMAGIRIYEYVLSLRAQHSVNLFDSQRVEEDGDSSEE
ncbi:MAG: hypothetical protein E7559_03620 [Ruminococcaceae bacterium]|nr:hypothetical protein [Oscillospiraceae bacterium]